MATKLETMQATLEKKRNTLKRHECKLEKLQNKLQNLAPDADDWTKSTLEYEIGYCKDDIERTKKDIAHREQAVANEKARVERFEAMKKIPDVFIPFRDILLERWNRYDIEERDRILAMGTAYYLRGEEKHDWRKREKFYAMKALTDEKIAKENERSIVMLIQSLITRCQKKVGNITDYNGLFVTKGNLWKDGGVAINGYVEGDKGTAYVDSIIAGGYNIQRLHVRVLVK